MSVTLVLADTNLVIPLLYAFGPLLVVSIAVYVVRDIWETRVGGPRRERHAERLWFEEVEKLPEEEQEFWRKHGEDIFRK